MHNKRVGLLSLQAGDNYGAVLVGFSMQYVIKELGYEAKTINFTGTVQEASSRYPDKTLLKKIIYRFRSQGIGGVIKALQNKLGPKQAIETIDISSLAREKKFDSFRETYLDLTSACKSVSNELLDYDVYVVGSDVVWQPVRVKTSLYDIYFLNFVKDIPCKRIAYAASLGTNNRYEIKEVEEDFARGMNNFDAVSIREESIIPNLQKLYSGKIYHCIDPTFLVPLSVYDDMIKNIQRVDEPYIYIYLFDDNPKTIYFVNNLIKKTGLRVISQCKSTNKICNVSFTCEDDGPLEFLSRIKNAQFVITDSFHGTVFSILWKKDFFTFSRGEMSVRMKDLLTSLNLMDRFQHSLDLSDLHISHDAWEYTFEKLNSEKQESINFLKRAIE